MIRISVVAIALCAALALAACGDSKPPAPASTAVTSPAPPAVAASAVPLPPLPSATGTDPASTAKDSAATDPKGTLSKEEESKSMPMAGQGNNHSSPSLEPPAKN